MKTKTCVLTLLLGIWCSIGTTQAESIILEGIRYETDNYEKTARVVPFDDKQYSGDLTIPASFEYNGTNYTVTEVDYSIFYENALITSVNLQALLKDEVSFYNCTGLVSVSLPDGMTELRSTFEGCTSLKEVRLPEDLQRIGYGVFMGCSSLERITIPASVKAIDSSDGFTGCTSLRELSFADSKDSLIIGYALSSVPIEHLYVGRDLSYSYFDCLWNTQTLKTAEVAGQAKKIISDMFNGCTALSNVTIGKNINFIGNHAFNQCTSLTSVTIPSEVDSIGWNAFSGCTGMQSVNIEEGVTTVAHSMFSECTSLSEVSLPSSLTTIGERAFYQCAVKDIVLPASVDSIGMFAFSGCAGLQTVKFPANLKKISISAFEDCSLLSSIELPDGLEYIGENAFADCAAMTSATLGGKLKSIGDGAFYECKKLDDVYFKGSLSEWLGIDILADSYPEDTNPLSYADRLYVDYGTDHQQLVSNMTVPENVTTIKQYAFAGYKGLTSALIPASVEKIEEHAFDGCSNLEQAEIRAGRISQYAFFGNIQLKNIVLGRTVTFIGNMAFNYVRPTQTTYEGTLGEWCRIFFASRTSNVFASGTLMINGEQVSGKLILPSNVTSVGQYAFYGCPAITSVTIPASTREIGKEAFAGCTNLVSVVSAQAARTTALSADGLRLGEGAFAYCSKLSDISLAQGQLIGIGANAFENTAWLNAQPEGVVYFSTYAYKYKGTMPENTTLTLLDGTTQICGKAFEDCTALTGITLPKSLKVIGEYAFSYSGLTSVALPAQIDSIGKGAFNGCGDLTSVKLPEGLKVIPASMFANCSSLTAISIPSSVEHLGDKAFYYCSGLKEITSFNPAPPVCEPYTDNYTTVFDGVYTWECTLKVPLGTSASYKEALGWNDFSLCEEFDPSGISDVLNEKSDGKAVHYDLNGRIIPAHAKGIHLIREADGSCRKVWVSPN